MRAALILLGIALFLVASFFFTRVLAADSKERSDVNDLLIAQARGDAGGMLRLLVGCEGPACRARVRANARRLRRPGEVQILRYDPSDQFAFRGGENAARVVWRTTRGEVPVVQCVLVRRTGDVLSGPGVELVRISGARGSETGC